MSLVARTVELPTRSAMSNNRRDTTDDVHEYGMQLRPSKMMSGIICQYLRLMA